MSLSTGIPNEPADTYVNYELEKANDVLRRTKTLAPGNTDPNAQDSHDIPEGYVPGEEKYGSLRSGVGGGGSGASGSGGRRTYTAPILPSATSQEEYINGMYDAYRQQQEEALRSAYETNLANLDYQAGKLPGTYDAAAQQAATQAEINRANFNESAAASGINTGAGSQVRLSQQNALLGNITAIRKAQADAQKDLDFQRTQLQNQYQNAIAEALAQNNLQRAQALYDEAKRVDESMVATAVNQANLDWTVWNALYNRRR